MKSLIVIISLLLSSAAIASELEETETHEDGGHHKHTLGLFAGVTIEVNGDLVSLGIEYSCRFMKSGLLVASSNAPSAKRTPLF